MRLLCIAVTLAAAAPIVSAAPRADAVPDDWVRFIGLGVRAARTGLPPGSAVIDRVETLAPASVALINWQSQRALVNAGPDGSATKHYRARWYREAQRLAVSVERQDRPTGAEKIFILNERLVSDGEHARSLRTIAGENVGPDTIGDGLARRGTVQQASAALPGGVWGMRSWADIAYLAYYARCFGEPKPLDDLLLDDYPVDPDMTVEYLGVEPIHDGRCHHLRVTDETEYRRDLWIDEEHGFVIRRATLSQELEGEAIHLAEEDVAEVTQTDGVWLPKSLETFHRFTRLETTTRMLVEEFKLEARGGLALFPRDREICTIVSAQFHDPPAPEVFVLEWPEGTVVTDAAEGSQRTARLLWPDEEKLLRDSRAAQ